MPGCSLGAQGGDQGHVCAAGGPTLMRTGPSASGPASDLPAQLWCNPLNCHRAPLRDAGTSTPRHGHFRNFPPSQTKIPTHPTLTTPCPPVPGSRPSPAPLTPSCVWGVGTQNSRQSLIPMEAGGRPQDPQPEAAPLSATSPPATRAPGPPSPSPAPGSPWGQEETPPASTSPKSNSPTSNTQDQGPDPASRRTQAATGALLLGGTGARWLGLRCDARVPWRAGWAPGPLRQLPANTPGESAWAPATRVGDPGAAPGFGPAWARPWRSSGE